MAVYLDTLTCLFLHTRLLKAHTKLLEAHTRLLETLSLSLSLLWSTVSGLLVKREAFSPCPQSVAPASYTPGLPKYIQKHRIIDINATDLWSLEAVTTLLRANPLQMYFFGGQARDFRAWSTPEYVSLSEIVLCGSTV